jgi:predicted TIM-barrel fold metal-dependent hydrolase
MISRRTVLKAALAAAGLGRLGAAGWAKAAQPRTKVDFEVPAGACDCHVHIFGDPRRFPFSPSRGYTPEPASIGELQALLRALGIDRVVVVQPSVYGTDNACTLDALRRLGPRSRGVAVIDEATPESSLDEMERAGIRGVRLNLAQAGATNPAGVGQRFRAAVDRIKDRNWHVQINCPPNIVESLSDQVAACPVPVVFDHFGGASAARGLDQPGFATLVSLVRSGKAYVKISGAADSVSTRGPDYPDAAPFARALVAANPERILWGSNWPHPGAAKFPGLRATEISPLLPTDDGRVLNLLAEWVREAAIRRAILVQNPARLYRF